MAKVPVASEQLSQNLPSAPHKPLTSKMSVTNPSIHIFLERIEPSIAASQLLACEARCSSVCWAVLGLAVARCHTNKVPVQMLKDRVLRRLICDHDLEDAS